MTGIALSVIGLIVIFATLAERPDFWSGFWGVAWGLVWLGFGVYIFSNKKEDEIERINNNQNEK